jgi:two-component system LytT family response regulator
MSVQPAYDLQPETTVRVLIVDDEPPGRERVRSLLEGRDHVEVIAECENGLEAVGAIEAQAPDVVFLDVEMPELNGLAVVEAIEPERCPQVVFVTAHDKYLQRAFEVHAVDYICKPFTDARFEDALHHACQRVEEHLGYARTHEGVLALLADLRQRNGQGRDRLVVHQKERGVYQVVRARDIEWIEAKDGGVLVHVGKEAYPARQTLKDLEERLDPRVFLRIHRSFIVNRTRICTVKPLWKGEYVVTLTSGRSLGTGRTYRDVVEAFLSSE